MEIEELQKLADSFFEWPTEDKTQVTLTSALLFAQHVLRMTQPKPIPTAWQPIESAPIDVLHVRGLWVYDPDGAPVDFNCDIGRIDDDGFFVDEFGNPHGWSAGDYTHWHPLEVPPAPGGEG